MIQKMKNKLIINVVALFLMTCHSSFKKSDPSIAIATVENVMQKEMILQATKAKINENKVSEIQEKFDHNNFDNILKTYVTVDGRVDYAGIKAKKTLLTDYIAQFRTQYPDKSWSKQDLLAYYMNAYNAMTIDLIVSNYPLKSIKDLSDPWGQRNWKIGKESISLEEIEHQILRTMGEPRIHFGINCASFSCPPLMNEAFNAVKVDQQLEHLAIKFINDEKRNKISKESVEVSKIFRWFKEDFTTNGDLIAFLNQYSRTAISQNARVRYMDYNWELNE
jgi:hypothetical protein